ncbi:HNH endonuclease signature motif containing protein [Brachybacterium sp. YJGR34]|uniref:HNH endonuclease signature motif containing protein n=1 Tax=Brachybacterium sp. YJGR34 TaxID=2059911 RepID=UPI000E0A4276|nr:HNH endonuclease signature motif containing protein [Brachybacterium sp. YJGR34]
MGIDQTCGPGGVAGAGDGDREAACAPARSIGSASVAGPAGTSGARRALERPAIAKSELEIVAREEELRLGTVDLLAARAAISEIGAQGASALDSLSAEEAIALLSGLEGLSMAMSALQARALVQLESAVMQDCLEREETPRTARKVARAEASRALRRSRSSAGRTMATCRRLVQSMPGMLTALAEGRVTAESSHRVGRVMGPASPELRGQVDEILAAHVPYLEDCGPREWGAEAEKVLHGLDPDGAAARHHQARRERSVTVRRTEHGMGVLTARLPGLDAARIRKGLSHAAEKARAEGDRRGHQQIMADLLADALIGRGDGVDPTALDIGVIITDRSLLAPRHADAATIEGFGPVPHEHIRDEMRRALVTEEDSDLALTLRRLYTDPEDGQLVAVESRSRAFPPALSRLLLWSHESCRAPFCDADIRHNDHIVPWSQGGPTSRDNGNGLCAGDNQKEESGESVRVVTDEDGTRRTVEWTTRYGQKARRRGVNHDPVGTARRRAERGRARSAAGTAPSEHRSELEDGTQAPLHRALTELEVPLTALPDEHAILGGGGRTRHWLRQQRRDYIVRGGVVMVEGAPPGPAPPPGS